MALSELAEFGPCFSAETVKACALIGLHMVADRMPFGRTGIPLLTQGKSGSVAVQKVRFGVTTALKRKEVRMLHPWSITNTMSTTSPLKSLGRTDQVK